MDAKKIFAVVVLLASNIIQAEDCAELAKKLNVPHALPTTAVYGPYARIGQELRWYLLGQGVHPNDRSVAEVSKFIQEKLALIGEKPFPQDLDKYVEQKLLPQYRKTAAESPHWDPVQVKSEWDEGKWAKDQMWLPLRSDLEELGHLGKIREVALKDPKVLVQTDLEFSYNQDAGILKSLVDFCKAKSFKCADANPLERFLSLPMHDRFRLTLPAGELDSLLDFLRSKYTHMSSPPSTASWESVIKVDLIPPNPAIATHTLRDSSGTTLDASFAD